jgi:hypothetical protein
MITERIAIVMLEGVVVNSANDPHHAKQLYKSIQTFADVSLKLCEEEKYPRLERLLSLALKLFKEGNQTVKNAIVNVYLYTLCRSMDKNAAARKWIEPFLPAELRIEYSRLHYASGL